jgi:hypothetical protein
MRMTWSAAVLAAACSSAPVVVEDPTGEKLVVHLLDADFVRVDGRRFPWQELVYDLRVRCRTPGQEPPWVELRAPAGAVDVVPAATVETLQHELRVAGVRHIEFTFEDG